MLVTNPVRASAWYHIFASYPEVEFTRRQLITFLQGIVDRQQQLVSAKSLERDVDCFLRTYVPVSHSMHILPEVALECPLAELGIIRGAEEEGVYRFCTGQKGGLPAHVIGFALMQFRRAYTSGRRTLGLGECLYAPGSPGQAFRLDESCLLTELEELRKLTGGKVDVNETAGTAQIYLRADRAEELDELAFDLLRNYYAREGRYGY